MFILFLYLSRTSDPGCRNKDTHEAYLNHLHWNTFKVSPLRGAWNLPHTMFGVPIEVMFCQSRFGYWFQPQCSTSALFLREITNPSADLLYQSLIIRSYQSISCMESSIFLVSSASRCQDMNALGSENKNRHHGC